jgi:hypothetical protein
MVVSLAIQVFWGCLLFVFFVVFFFPPVVCDNEKDGFQTRFLALCSPLFSYIYTGDDMNSLFFRCVYHIAAVLSRNIVASPHGVGFVVFVVCFFFCFFSVFFFCFGFGLSMSFFGAPAKKKTIWMTIGALTETNTHAVFFVFFGGGKKKKN